MKQKNPFTQEIENMSVLELMNLKQIANALEGDLSAFKEIIDRHEGKVVNKTEDVTPQQPKTITIKYKRSEDTE